MQKEKRTNMLQSHMLLMLLITSTALTVFTASMISSSLGFTLLDYLPSLCKGKGKANAYLNATVEGFEDGANTVKIDYSDVDYLSNDLERQIIQLLGNEKDSVHKMEDIYPGQNGLLEEEKQKQRVRSISPYLRYRHPVPMPFLRKKIADWQLEIFYNAMFEPFWPKMRLLLKNWVDNRRFEPHIVQNLLQSVKRPIDEIYHSDQQAAIHVGRRYSACAVVGNSGILLNASYGKTINQHEMVMRLNNARTTGFEKFVGSKTTISFVNSHMIRLCAKRSQCWCHPYGAKVPIITYLCAPWHFMPIAFCSSVHAAPLLVTDPRFDNLCNRIAKWYSVKLYLTNQRVKPDWWSILRNPNRQFHYSSGFQAVVLALGLCDNVDIFGFGKAKGLKHHYFSQQTEELKEIHDYGAEYEFYHDLERNSTGLIPFFKGGWIFQLAKFQDGDVTNPCAISIIASSLNVCFW